MMINVGSPAWFLVMGFIALVVIVLSRVLRGRNRAQKLAFMEKLSIGTFCCWVFYKGVLALDPGYDFHLLNELPLHLCNIGTLLSIVAARKDVKPLQAFLYYWITFGALIACVTPDMAFCGVPLYTPRCIGYWGYHSMMVAIPLLYVTSGIYRPQLGDIVRAMVVLLGIGFAVYGVNLVLRATVYADANYCYSFGMPGNPLTDTLQKFIPIPVIYMLPMFVPIVLIDVGMYYIGRGKKK